MTGHFIETNNIKLHYLEYKGDAGTIISLHGLTANAHAFEGLLKEWEDRRYRIIAPDLRGRGLSDKPAFCYTMEEHAKDIIGLMDELGIERAVFKGHSFGGLLSSFMSVEYPDRVEKLIILDAAAELNPKAPEMLLPTLARLDKHYPSWDVYLDEVKNAPFNKEQWNDDMLGYYKADVMDTPDGGVTPRSNLTNILEASVGVRDTPWDVYMERITQPALLINALDNYTMDEPLLPDDKAKETVAMLQNGQYAGVDGNHHTMLYGKNAQQVIAAINKFL